MDTHRNLKAWQACRTLVGDVYRMTARFPGSERFGLTSQLRRATVSAAANIAEGNARTGLRETARGLSIALGSLAEVDTLLVVAEDLGYLDEDQAVALRARFLTASKLTAGLLRSVRSNASRLVYSFQLSTIDNQRL